MKQRNIERALTDAELAKHALASPRAWRALNEFWAIRDAGGKPVVYHGSRYRYRVVDELADQAPHPRDR